MDCCQHNQGLNTIFNKSNAQSEAKTYWKKGIEPRARKLAEAISARGIQGASLLEVGGGVGGLQMELLKRGAARAIDVDVSAAYVDAAQAIAERLGLRDRVEYHVADFARESGAIAPADVVVLDRVVCCYPDMPGLVGAAAGHARRVMALTFPRGVWFMRLGGRLMNFWMWLTRSGYRFYVHDPTAIKQIAAGAGLRAVQEKYSGTWQIVVFER